MDANGAKHARRCIVTGATSGIGKEIARGLLERGASVAIIGRNPAKLAATVDELGGGVDTYTADLSELADVRRLADELLAREPRVDVLVNNAGINAGNQLRTRDGLDPMLSTNYLAPWLLTTRLLDRLRASAPARVVNVASEAHRLSDRIDPAQLTEFDAHGGQITINRLYGRTKLELLLFTQELAARVADDGVIVNAMCPGLVATNLVGASSPVTRVANVLSVTPFVRRPAQGAAMAIALALDSKYDGVTGEFFSSTPGAGLLPPHPARKDGDLQRALWDATDRLVNAG